MVTQISETDFSTGIRQTTAAKSGAETSGFFQEALSRAMANEKADEERRVYSLRPCGYFSMADEDGCINYNGVTFLCDKKENRLTLGDVTNERNCIKVGLSRGGSLVFNRGAAADVFKALSMFDKEDQDRILAAIEQDKLVRHAYNKNRQDETDDILDMAPEKNGAVKDHLSEEEEGHVKSDEEAAADGEIQQ